MKSEGWAESEKDKLDSRRSQKKKERDVKVVSMEQGFKEKGVREKKRLSVMNYQLSAQTHTHRL